MADDAPQPTQGGQVGLANANANLNFDLGDMFGGNTFASYKRNLREQYRQYGKYGARANRAYQAQHIQGLVEGARQAGMHPLFALGGGTGGGAGSMPVPIGATGAGPSVSGGAAVSNKAIRSEEMLLVASQTKMFDKQAEMYDALAKKALSEIPGNQDGAKVTTEVTEIVDPRRRTASRPDDPSIEAGKKGPAWTPMAVFKDGPEFLVPGGQLSEAFDNLGMAMLFMAKNWKAVNYYGWKKLASVMPHARAAKMVMQAARKYYLQHRKQNSRSNARSYPLPSNGAYYP